MPVAYWQMGTISDLQTALGATCRPEQRIAVVSHAGFIRHTLSVFAGSLPPQPAEALQREFLNCELRTMVCTLLSFNSQVSGEVGGFLWAACRRSWRRRYNASSSPATAHGGAHINGFLDVPFWAHIWQIGGVLWAACRRSRRTRCSASSSPADCARCCASKGFINGQVWADLGVSHGQPATGSRRRRSARSSIASCAQCCAHQRLLDVQMWQMCCVCNTVGRVMISACYPLVVLQHWHLNSGVYQGQVLTT